MCQKIFISKLWIYSNLLTLIIVDLKWFALCIGRGCWIGVQDIKIVQVGESTALIVAVSNTDACLENSCKAEDLLTFEQANPVSSVRFCGCPYAISTSFVMLYNPQTKKFDLDAEKPLSFRTFRKGPDLVYS